MSKTPLGEVLAHGSTLFTSGTDSDTPDFDQKILEKAAQKCLRHTSEAVQEAPDQIDQKRSGKIRPQNQPWKPGQVSEGLFKPNIPADAKIFAGGALKKRLFHETITPEPNSAKSVSWSTPIEEAYCQTNPRKSSRLKMISISTMPTESTVKDANSSSDSSSQEEEQSDGEEFLPELDPTNAAQIDLSKESMLRKAIAGANFLGPQQSLEPLTYSGKKRRAKELKS